MKQKKIYTSGYEGISVDTLVSWLQKEKIKVLLDVRAVPLSRKAGFSKNVLAATLEEAGIDYVGLRGLGTPPDGRLAARRKDKEGLRKIYTAHLKTPEAVHDMATAIRIAGEKRSCLLCFERDPTTCHRLLVAERMAKKTGQKIVHLPSGKEP